MVIEDDSREVLLSAKSSAFESIYSAALGLKSVGAISEKKFYEIKVVCFLNTEDLSGLDAWHGDD